MVARQGRAATKGRSRFLAEIEDYKTILQTVVGELDPALSWEVRARKAVKAMVQPGPESDEEEEEEEVQAEELEEQEEQQQAEVEQAEERQDEPLFRFDSEERGSGSVSEEEEELEGIVRLPTVRNRPRYEIGKKTSRHRTKYWPLLPSRTPIPAWSLEDEVSHIASRAIGPSADKNADADSLHPAVVASLAESTRDRLARTLALLAAYTPPFTEKRQLALRPVDWERVMDVVVVGKAFDPEVIERVRERMEAWEGQEAAELAMARMQTDLDMRENLRALHAPYEADLLADWIYIKPKMRRGRAPLHPKRKRRARVQAQPGVLRREKVAPEDLESEDLGSGSDDEARQAAVAAAEKGGEREEEGRQEEGEGDEWQEGDG